ncbi:hypothetical protein ES702_07406 [subsurface metagenome]
MIKPIIFKKSITLTASQSLTGQKRPIDVPFLLGKLTASATGIFKTRLDLNGKPMSRDQIANANLFGVSTYPMILSAFGHVPFNGEITIDITDLSAAPNVVNLVFIGLTGTENELKELTDNYLNFPYFYSGEKTLLSTGEDKAVIKADVDYPFRMVQLMAAKTGIFDAEIKINNDSLNRGRMPDTTLFGTAQLPMIIEPYDVKRGGIIETDLKDTSVAGNTVKLAFGGYKVTR